MHLELDLLNGYGAVTKKYKKNDFIFTEGETSRFYFQVLEGKVKMCNINQEGKEFTHGVFEKGQSFGEPPMILDEQYPTSAIAMIDCEIIKLSKASFMKLMDENTFVQKAIIICLAKRVYNKANTFKNIVSQNPQHRILAFLDTFKSGKNSNAEKTKIQCTRQEIANFTGLRVETVIRTIKKMESENQVKILNRKLYY